MKKLITGMVLAMSLMVATPAFAYEVQSGDTMSKIASENDMSLNELATLNPEINNINLIYVGQNVKTDASEVDSKQVTSATPYEQDLMARLVRAEAESEPYAGKVAVATVVLNRVDDDYFPDNIASVIYQTRQFTPVSNGEINKQADPQSVKAVEEALAFDRSQGAGSLFFYNPVTSTSRWLDSKQTTLVIGNHVFKK